MKLLEICPYEPPASGWVNRVKLLRRVVEQRGGHCEVLDIGPHRTVERPGCVPVYGGRDYLAKVARFARDGYTLHLHVNGEYFRGALLALAACLIGRRYGRRCVTTFHAGAEQPYFQGRQRLQYGPVYRALLGLSHAVVCNSEAVKDKLAELGWAKPAKTSAIPAFSRQYLNYSEAQQAAEVDAFCRRRRPLLSTYLCFRDGFFTDVVLDAMRRLIKVQPNVGLVIVGTGPERDAFLQRAAELGVDKHLCLAGDLDHDPFMTLIAASVLHLRTPVTDGVSSTVLEALHLGVPVVAADNGTRPASVITYPADDPAVLASTLMRVLADRDNYAASVQAPAVADTAAVEVDLLAGAALTALRPEQA